jgi:hypothetical protein
MAMPELPAALVDKAPRPVGGVRAILSERSEADGESRRQPGVAVISRAVRFSHSGRIIGRQPHTSREAQDIDPRRRAQARQPPLRPPRRCRFALRLTNWPSTAKTMVATTNQLPTIAATTPITIAIAIAMHATRTLV